MPTARVATWLAFSLALSTAASTLACGGSTTKSDESAGDDAGSSDDGSEEAGPVTWTAIPLSACSPSVVYVAPFSVGDQDFSLLVDTGSATLGVASSSCTTCSGVTPLYTPGSTATDEKAMGTSPYKTGSWSGEIYEDTVAAGTASTSVPVKFVAIDSQQGFFSTPSCGKSGRQGIVGFGPAKAELTGTNVFFDDFVAQQNVPNVFATQLCDTGGTLWLGGFDPAATTAAPSYTPLLTTGSIYDPYYYVVDLASISVAGTTIQVSTAAYPGAILDTGSSVSVLGPANFTALTEAIAASAGFTSIFGNVGASWFSNPSNCKPLTQTKAEIDAALPPLTLVFGSSPSISVQAVATESYLFPYAATWCPAIIEGAQAAGFPFSLDLGAPLLKSNVVVFDRDKKQVGFAPHAACK